jgi:hypothetical protein
MPHDEDFRIEPVRGLPERPPEGETILWQGAPQPWALAKSALNAQWIAGYFLALGIWRGVSVATQSGPAEGLVVASWFAAIGAIAVAVVALMAWAMARATVYTLTNRRVVMRIGAALTVTLNLPYQWIAAAHLSRERHGLGTIAFELKGSTRISYLVLWPHCRPWTFRAPQPALRSIPDAEAVARLLAEAARTRISEVDDRAAPMPAHPIAAE